MFERYTRRHVVIFFARMRPASLFALYRDRALLLGLLREDKALTNRFLRSHASWSRSANRLRRIQRFGRRFPHQWIAAFKRVQAGALCAEKPTAGPQAHWTNICCWGFCAKRSALRVKYCRARLKLRRFAKSCAVTQEKAPPQQRQRESSCCGV